VLLAALLALCLGGNRWLAAGLARSLEWRYLPPLEIPAGQALVVLGGGTLPADYPRQMVEVNGAGDRLIYAAWLYRQGKAEHILVSGGGLDWEPREIPQAEEMAVQLEMLGVPRDVIWLESSSHNTYENALFSKRILEPLGIQRILLVTSAMHMPRSVKLFQAQEFEVIPLPVDYTITEAIWQSATLPDLRLQVLNLLPSTENLNLTTRALKEYLGILTYSVRGWK